MICFFCHRRISGADMQARYEWRIQGGEVIVYGKGEGDLKYATGRLVKVCHNKCYHADKKRNELAAAKAADPSAQSRPDTDWRHQETIDVGELVEGNGDDRGAGAPRR